MHLLEIALAGPSATDLGHLLAKNPARWHGFPLPFGQATVLFPRADHERCESTLLLEVDPDWLPRSTVEDLPTRPTFRRTFEASALTAWAIATVFESAVAGRSRERPERVAESLPLEARLSVVPCPEPGGGLRTLQELFAPLGYSVDATLCRPDEGARSSHAELRLSGTLPLRLLLSHLCVLLVALDEAPREVLPEATVERLLRLGQGWLDEHPRAGRIRARCEEHPPDLVGAALDRLLDPEEARRLPVTEDDGSLDVIIGEILEARAARLVLDAGCGDARRVAHLLGRASVEHVTALDASWHALEQARRRLEPAPEERRERCDLVHGSLLYEDRRWCGFDAALLVDVLPFDDAVRLETMGRNLLRTARPAVVVAASSRWPAELEAWARVAAERFGYRVASPLASHPDLVILERRESSR